MATTARMTITVPVGVKAQIDATTEPVNWSAVASRAFQDKLAELVSDRGVQDVQDAITRLRASKRKDEDATVQAGRQAGERWARTRAEVVELERLESYREQASHDWDAYFYGAPDAYGFSGAIASVIDPDCKSDFGRTVEFWELALGEGFEAQRLSENGDFVKAFAEGALEFYDSVKDQL